MDRLHSGISLLDELIQGGFPRDINILVLGDTGAGKTVFCNQFLVNGALKYGESGLLISADERPQDLREDMLSLSLDIEKLEKKGMIKIIDARSFCSDTCSDSCFDFDLFIQEISQNVQYMNAQRLVLDSVDGFEGILGDFSTFTKFIFQFSRFLMSLETTSLLTTRFASTEKNLTRYKDVELLCQGIIHLRMESRHGINNDLDLIRVLRIQKLLGTAHILRKIPFEIKKGGVEIYYRGELH